jgi:hypothetical protein
MNFSGGAYVVKNGFVFQHMKALKAMIEKRSISTVIK